MSVTLMALYHRGELDDEALETFRARYRDEHLPLVRQTPGLRSLHVARVVQAFSESDLFMVARMIFDDRATLDDGLASDQMRAAGRILREILPRELVTIMVLEPDATLGSELAAEKTGDEPLDEPSDGATDGATDEPTAEASEEATDGTADAPAGVAEDRR
ncbi:MAG TPA: EthD family reductase [Candidatus Limnocylindrales bacterium]|nr:EthD family reductase [Candidatus Limnocylindrales bacterium]